MTGALSGWLAGGFTLSPTPGEIASTMACDGREPRGKLLRIAHAPARFPGFNERILNDVLGFLAALQNAVGNGEKVSTGGANDHLKSVAIALDGCAIDGVFI